MNRNALLWLLALAGLFAGRVRGAIEFHASLADEHVYAGCDTHLQVEATWAEEPGTEYRILPPRLDKAKNFEIRKQLSPCGETVAESGEVRQRRVFEFVLRAAKVGPASTGEIQVPYYRIVAQPSPAGQDVQAAKAPAPEKLIHRIAPITVNVEKSPGLGLAEKLVIGAGAFAAAIVLAIWFVDRRVAKRRPDAAAQEENGALEEDHLSRLRGLRALRLEGDVKAYCGKVSDVLDSYLKHKFPEDVPHAFSDADRQDCGEVRRVAEAVRFAGHTPTPEELDRLMARASGIISRHLPKKLGSDPTEGIELKDEVGS